MSSSHDQVQAQVCREQLIADRNELVAFLKTQSSHVPATDICKALRFTRMRIGMIVTAFPSYFVSWKEEVGHNRKTYVDLHHHLAMRRIA